MRVFVTGAAGFVGGHLLPRLAQASAEVEAHDLELDVANPVAVEAALAAHPPDAVVHLAALSSVPASRGDPALTYRVNFLGTRAVLAGVARRAPRARVLLVGSGDEYGPAAPGAPPFTEASPLRPRSPYACSKAAAGLLGARFAARGIDVVRTRSFNHTGPGQSDAFVASSFARQLAEMECGRREAVLRVGNLDSVRDFLDVGDVVEAYLGLLASEVPGGIYNVASGRAIRVGDVLDGLLAHARVRPRIEVDAERYRAADFSTGDSSRLRAATGWEPRIPLDRTLGRLLDAWRASVSGA